MLDKLKKLIPSKKQKSESLDDFKGDDLDYDTADISIEDLDFDQEIDTTPEVEETQEAKELPEQEDIIEKEEEEEILEDIVEEEPIDDIEQEEIKEPIKKELSEKEQAKKDSKLKKQAEKEAKKKIRKEKIKNFKYLDKNTKLLLSNAFLIVAIVICYSTYGSTKENLRDIEVYKSDIKKINTDNGVVVSNLALLDEERDQALEYRRLNFFLDQAVPKSDKYEDNLAVILRILSESINLFSRNPKYLDALSLKTDTKINDIQTFNTETERILGISYNMSVSGFTRIKDVEDFLSLITNRLKIFHIENLGISKVYDQNTNESQYKINIQMYSYYRLPNLDEFGELVEAEKESTF